MTSRPARVDNLIRLDSSFDASFAGGELRFLIDGAIAANGVYVDDETGELLLAQWLNVALSFEPKGKDDGKRLIDQLRRVATDAPSELRRQIIERQQQLSELTSDIRDHERRMHELTCSLFQLTPAERQLVGQLN